MRKSSEKGRPPRMMYLKFPLGRAFGTANNIKLQQNILKDLLEFSINGGKEEIVELPYRWKDWRP